MKSQPASSGPSTDAASIASSSSIPSRVHAYHAVIARSRVMPPLSAITSIAANNSLRGSVPVAASLAAVVLVFVAISLLLPKEKVICEAVRSLLLRVTEYCDDHAITRSRDHAIMTSVVYARWCFKLHSLAATDCSAQAVPKFIATLASSSKPPTPKAATHTAPKPLHANAAAPAPATHAHPLDQPVAPTQVHAQ